MNNTLIKSIFLCGVLIISHQAFSQLSFSKQSERISGYVEYMEGNMPLVISVPHGGYDRPDSIPERTGHFAKNQDIYTIEIAYKIYKRIYKQCGYHPHIVINHLHRTRLDANRNIEEAADGSPAAEKIWYVYHGLLDSIQHNISEKYDKGLFIDLHGHRHSLQRIEIGYLLSAEELKLDNEMLNTGLLDNYTSIRNLLKHNKNGDPLAEVIRGENSLGSYLYDLGQPCVPCSATPNPQNGEKHFSGGYNTMRHGSSGGGVIDGIQLEIDLQTRSNPKRQKKVAHDISDALLQYISFYYFPELEF